MEKNAKNTIISYAGSLFGAFLYSFALNYFVIPHKLYSGTLTGVAQIVEALFVEGLGLTMPAGINLTGIVLLMLNIPLLLMVRPVTKKDFMHKSVVTIVFMTVLLAVLPIPTVPPISDPLTTCIIGGIIAGFGAGFTLRCGGSGGGTDIIGVYCSVKFPGFTVGKISRIIGAAVYLYCLLRYELNTIVYSAIYTVIYGMALDQTHHQNIKTSALIFTTNPASIHDVLHEMGRGATAWEGRGAYSGQPMHVYMTVISKYEVGQLRRIVKSADPHAFIILNQNVGVTGNYVPRL